MIGAFSGWDTMQQERTATAKARSAFNYEAVRTIHHWNDTLFSFTTTRMSDFRFENGEFVMIGLEVDGRPLLRAYSVASPNYEEHLEFLSIKVPDGPLTSRLQHLREGDIVLIGRKPTGTLLLADLLPGKILYLFGTGTGLAPFMSIVRDPLAYERFDKVVLVHGVRHVSELAYHRYLTEELHRHEYLGEMVREKFIYYPTVTREPFEHQGRITHLIETGRLFTDLGLPPLDPERDRAMVCGSMSMLKDTSALLDQRGFVVAPHIGAPGHYVIERAFAER